MVPPSEPVEVRTSPELLRVRAEPAADGPWRGLIAANEPFEVFGHQTGPGCAVWGIVAGATYACLDGTTLAPSGATPPQPASYTYARRDRQGSPVYASVEAWVRGDGPAGHLRPDHSYRFVQRIDTASGEALVTADGDVVPASAAYLYAPSEFLGRDLAAEPVPEGSVLGWCITTDGCPWGEGRRVAFHEAFLLASGEAPPEGRTRTWRTAEPPSQVGPDDVWADIDVREQTLTLLRGAVPLFATLVSTGVGGRFETPRDTRRVTDKIVDNNMTSLPGSAEPYAVEGVPWVVHFRPRYALHGTYWHDRFGLRASHGCVNLSPADARRVFEALGPPLPMGWRQVVTTETLPGSWVRIR